MKFVTLILCVLLTSFCHAQLLSWSPNFIQDNSSSVTITCDATKGNQGLLNYTPTTDVYVHLGAITTASTSPSDWKYAPYTWATTNALAQCTYLGNNKWSYTINGGLRTYFGMTNASEKILRIAILFRSGNGNKALRNSDGGDMYVPVYDNGLYARIDTPLRQPFYTPTLETITKNVGDNISIFAKASQSSTMKIFFNGTAIATASAATQVSAAPSITATGTQTIIAEANNGTSTARDTISFLVSGGTTFAPLPSGVVDGINYESGDTSVTLVLFAPKKTKIFVTGDFNNWTPTTAYQMNETLDSNRFWIRLKGLTPGTEYAYQYVIDASLTVADYNAEKILDPANDQYIPSATYPSLKAYPTGKTTGIVSVLQTAKPAYNWQVTTFTKPSKNNLVIYELLIRDFVAAANWQTLKDTLTYLKRLGVNAIEVMPFNEFEGNLSWGYNPNFYFAPDKYYGTENSIRQFIDQCHLQGIAVIMDMVMNHSMGSSPMAQMYWDATNNIPAANNPWFNQYPTHPFNVGNDFNHSSQATKDFVDRVVTHWLTKYKIDGFRWDLSKGFTQTNSCTNPPACNGTNDVANMGHLDASRIAIWERIYDKMQAVVPSSYCILEHFADNSEQTILANYGMLLWGNENYNFNQATMGYSTGWDFSGGIFTTLGWNNPNLVMYQESHDEERLMNKNELYGNTSGSYNIKDTATGLKRNEMAAAFWAMIPGPKSMWQFGELGYDYSINACQNGTVDATGGCRTDNKAIRWDYYANANRRSLYNVYSKLIQLKLIPNYLTTFTTHNVTYSTSSGFKWMVLNDDSLKVVVMGNFDVTAQSGSVTFPSSGTWYSYLTGATRTATGSAESITLQPGEYYVYTSKNVNATVVTAVAPVNNDLSDMEVNIIPNPANTATTVWYNLPKSGTVNISVMDMAGRKLTNLFNGFKAKGQQSISLNSNGFNTAQLETGIYLLQIQENGQRRTEKFVVVN